MGRALAVFRGVSQHGAGCALVISGSPGIGKTAVLAEICRQAATMGFRVAAGRCEQIEHVRPGTPVIALLRAGADPLASAEEYAKVTRLAAEPLLFADQIAALLEGAAMARPLLIAIDDLQWADRVSRFTLRMLFSRLIGLPVVWLLASGAELETAEVMADVAGYHQVRGEHIQLGPLPAEEIEAIAADRLGQPPDERARKFLATADGSPFLAVQIMNSLVRSAARSDPDPVPVEFTAAIAHQVAALPGISRGLVQLLAVAGRPLPVRDVSALLPGVSALLPGVSALLPGVTASLSATERAVATAIESGLIRACGPGLAFRHDLVLEAVYATMPVALTRTLHLMLADYYLTRAEQPLLAASHARAGAAPGDLGCAEILVCAAETLAPVSADEAGDLAALAIRGIGPEQTQWLDLSLRCLSVLCRVQRATEAIAVADVILARADDVNTIGRVEAEAARALWLGGRIGELVARADRVLSQDAELDPCVAARLRAGRALARTRLAAADVAATEAAAALECARVTGDRDALTLALQAAGEAASNEARHDTALKHFRELRCVTGGRGITEEIMALQFLDRFDHAQTLLDQALLDQGMVDQGMVDLPALQYARAWQDFTLGRLDDADASARTLIDLGQQLGNGLYTMDAIIIRVCVSLLRGQTETAAAQLRQANDLNGSDERVRRPGLAVASGWLAASRGSLEQALAVLRPVVEGGGPSRSYWPLWPCWNGLFFEFASLAGDEALTAACIDIAEGAAARNPGVASFEGVALNLRGRQKKDLDIIASSARALALSPRPVLRAFGAQTYGLALLAAGQRSAALAQLDRAWDIYHHMGAWGWRSRVQRVMREAGARDPKWTATTVRGASGWQSLTEAECRVAGLIGDGHTNKSAASELGVSVNTVGTHLRAVFAKLGIQSRVQLANELHKESVTERGSRGSRPRGSSHERGR